MNSIVSDWNFILIRLEMLEMTFESCLMAFNFLLASFAIIFYFLYPMHKENRKLPPGPYWNPLGNMYGRNAKEAKEYLLGLKKYGDICCLRVLGRPTIYLNSFERIKELYVGHGDTTSGRLDLSAVKHRLTIGRGLIMNDGVSWVDHRRFVLSSLRDFGFGRGGTEQIIQNELQILITEFEKEKQPFDPRFLLNMATCNVICSLVFNSRCGSEPAFGTLLALLEKSIKSDARIHDYFIARMILLLARMPTFLWSQATRDLDIIAAYLQKKIEEHRERYDGTVNDLIDAYLLEMKNSEKNGGQHKSFNEHELCRSIMDLFMAGMETTATTLRWALLFMIQNPAVQKRVQNELDERLQGRLPTAADRRELPYTEAVIMEVHRAATLAPVGAIAHRCTEELHIDKFVIPKDSLMFANVYAVHRDTTKWTDAFNFNPNNFFDETTGTVRTVEYLMPFGLGKRSCLGESLAKQELLIFLAGLLQKYEFQSGDVKIPTEEDCLFGRLRVPPSYRVVVRKR